ncbi:unnamed protein product [Orchesella dallaii]|uniref:Hexosyltransferase n=1 Tax=Orchesella dallaii TaxID=48710 RepID=A0ABP1PRU9_9HEXA
MKNGEIRVVTAESGNKRRRKIVYFIPLFLAAVSIGFLLNATAYESISTSEIRLVIAHLPQKLSKIRNWQTNTDAGFLKPLNEQSQFNNDTKEYSVEQLAKLLQLSKEPNLLNLNFTWLKNNDSICKLNSTSHPELKLMPVLIHTARSHFEERRVIRESWGSLSIYKNWTLRLVFLLGEADRGFNPQVNQKEFETQEEKLSREQKEYGDLVMGSFTDSYKNLTYKHLMGYKWVLNFCQNAEFVLKVDDDMFVDVMRFIDWRSSEIEVLEKQKKLNELSELYCHTFGGAKPIRESGSKWYAPEDQWPDEYYPDYCSGWAYGISVKLMELIYSVSNRIKFFWIDDVFVTGALIEVVKKVYNYQPEIRHLWGKITMDDNAYKHFCKVGDIKVQRPFEAVAVVSRGKPFEPNMKCMWNKTLHDSNLDLSN